MHTQPRRGQIEKLVLHDNEGPKGPGAAQSLRNYLNQIDGGYHAICDDTTTVLVVGDDVEVWGNGGINSTSLDCCLIGYARDPWTDPYSVAEIARAAQWFAQKCAQYGIPARRLTPQEVATPGVRGLCRHWDVTLAGFPGSAGHSDPGPNFDFDAFVAQVAALLDPHPTPDPKPPEVEDVLTFPCPGFPDVDGNKAHAQFSEDVAPHGGVILRWGARIAHDLPVEGHASHVWGPPLHAGATGWKSAYARPDGRGIVLVDDKGGTTDATQGLFNVPA